MIEARPSPPLKTGARGRVKQTGARGRVKQGGKDYTSHVQRMSSDYYNAENAS
jgi:hypothetical protein